MTRRRSTTLQLGTTRQFGSALPKNGIALLGAVLLGAALAVACSGEEPAASSADSRAPGPRRNLLIVAIDTLRADHLGLYGYPRPTSPRLDAFFGEGVVFDDAQSSSSWTLPSFATFMTGLETSSHGCWNFRSSLSEEHATLAEVLAADGFHTAGVVSHVFLTEERGLRQGFEHYDTSLVPTERPAPPGSLLPAEEFNSPQVTERAVEWLHGIATDTAIGDGDERPWFLWVHYFDPHDPYLEHPGFTETFGKQRKVDLYDGEIAFTDHHIGVLFDALEASGEAEDTVVVLIGDHGEEFHDHGGTGHGKTLYQEVVRVPFAVRAPGIAPRRVSETVRGVDVLPTLLDLVGARTPAPKHSGRSLAGAMRGETLEPAGSLSELARNDGSHVVTYIFDDWKLALDTPADPGAEPTVALYDRRDDPYEKHDLAAEHPDRVADLRARLEAHRAAAQALGGTERETAVTGGELEVLEALGYTE